ncbi:MAG: serine/threonine protein kinase, partial [Candidatus Riflebacteria bacterium]|nr:serine/threonine protein kinase [Candidatus Riflebacteria bacterium]
MASSPPALPPECARKFKVDRLLGSGGFGSVWLAIQQGLNRPGALKVLNKGVLEDRELVERFKNEALITASLA